MTEKEQKIFDMQSPSTKKAMLQSKEDRDKHWNSPVPEHRAVPDAKSWEEAVNARALSLEEVKIYDGLRLKRGEILAELRKEEALSSVSAEKRERGILAFMRMTADQIMIQAGLQPFFEKPESEHQKLMKKLDATSKRLEESDKRINEMIKERIKLHEK